MIKHVELINNANKTLRGYYTFEEESEHIVIFFHGFTGNKSEHSYHFRDFSRLLNEHKIASLRLDFSSNGESDGTFDEFNMQTLIYDAILIVEYAKTIPNIKKISFLGYSMGGAVCTIILPMIKEKIENIILWAPAFSINTLIRKYYDAGLEINNFKYHNIFPISKKMYQSTFLFDPLKDLCDINNKVLLIHGEKDLTIDYSLSIEASKILKNASLNIIEDAGHGFDRMNEKSSLYSLSLKFLLENS